MGRGGATGTPPTSGDSAPSHGAASRHSRTASVVVLLAALAVFLAAFHSIVDPDIWFHLRGGSEVVDAGSIPRFDTYSYPSEGNRYIDLHWLFQVVVYGVYRVAGESGLILFTTLVVWSAFAGLYRLARRHLPAAAAAALTVTGAVLASERFAPRPEIVSFALLVLGQWMLVRHREGARGAIWFFPLLVAVWVNTEGLFVLAYALLAAHLLDRPRDRRAWIALCASIAAAWINPYFTEGALHPLILFTRINRSLPIYSNAIGEFLGPFKGEALHPSVALLPWYLGGIGLVLLLMIAPSGRSWPRRGEIFLLAVFIYLGLSARRNVALLAIVATPILARWISLVLGHRYLLGWWQAGGQRRRARISAAIMVSAMLILGAYCLALVNSCLYDRAELNTRTGFGPSPADFPREGARYLRENAVRGPLFATFAAGSFLTWAYPEEKIFIDGRLEVHDPAHFDRYLRLLRGGPMWDQAVEEFGFSVALVEYVRAMELTLRLLQDRTWALVHLDDTAAVFLRRNDQNASLIERDAVTPARLVSSFEAVSAENLNGALDLPPPAPDRSWLPCLSNSPFPWSQMNLGQFFFAINRQEMALAQFLEAARRDPGAAAPRALAAAALQRMGRPEAALRLLEEAERLARTAEMRQRIWTVRGDALTALGRTGEAVAAYDRVLERPSNPAQVPALLAARGLARLRSGGAEAAAADLRESLRRDPRNAQAWWILGMVEEARGNPLEARRAYEQVGALGVRIPEVEAALQRLTAGNPGSDPVVTDR